jgi:hypothetical protein
MEVEVADQRHCHSHLGETVTDFRHCGGGFFTVYRNPHKF